MILEMGLLGVGLIRGKVVQEIKRILFQITFSLQNRAVFLIMCRNTKGGDRPGIIEQNITERRFDLHAG